MSPRLSFGVALTAFATTIAVLVMACSSSRPVIDRGDAGGPQTTSDTSGPTSSSSSTSTSTSTSTATSTSTSTSTTTTTTSTSSSGAGGMGGAGGGGMMDAGAD
jgi:hypothetical protein